MFVCLCVGDLVRTCASSVCIYDKLSYTDEERGKEEGGGKTEMEGRGK